MLIVDSSIIIALFRPKEEHHNAAKNIIETNSDFIVLDYVLSECLTVLKMREGHKVAFDCADFLIKNSDFTFTHLKNEEFNESLHFFTKNKNKLSFVDTTLLILSKSLGVPVATFDKDLQKALSS